MSKLISKNDFIKLFDNYDITISDSDYSRFETYADLLCEWNEKINLTAITDPEGISIKHFFDSVYPFTLFEIKENATVIDVGTGAGFPSCPLKIVRDDIKLIQCQLMKVSRMDVQQDCCRRAYIKGVFMTSGSISDPNKGYHMEVVCENEGRAQFIQEIIKGFGVEARIIQRKKYYVVYLKDGEMIVDMLGIMGAHISLMNMENIRIRKDIRNNINRRVNCEAANLNKTVSAAVKQMNDINYIIETKGIGYLPDNLQELALARLENEDASLKELGEMMTPPIGKSGVNHRLRKISEIAEEMRGC